MKVYAGGSRLYLGPLVLPDVCYREKKMLLTLISFIGKKLLTVHRGVHLPVELTDWAIAVKIS